MPGIQRLTPLLWLCAGIGLVGCPGEEAADDDSAGTGDDDGVFFALPPEGSTFVYDLDGAELPAAFTGPELLVTEEYYKLEFGDFTSEDPDGLKIWFRYTDEVIEAAGAQVYTSGLGAVDTAFFEYFLDTLLVIDLSAPLNTPQDTHGAGEMCFYGTNCDPFQIDITYTVVERDASVTAPAGTEQGCIHLTMSISATDLGGAVLEADYYLKSGVGLISGTFPPGYDSVELVSFTAGG